MNVQGVSDSLYNVWIKGSPEPKGSVSAFPMKRKGGRMGAVVVHSKKSKDWEQRIKKQLKDAPKNLEGPLYVALQFYLPRPKTVKRVFPAVQENDIDKLARTVLDAIKGVILDDGLVVDLIASKRYALPGQEGVNIDIRMIEDEQVRKEEAPATTV